MTFARSLIVVFLVAITAIASGQSVADRIWVQPLPRIRTQSNWYPRAIETIDGRIVDFDNEKMRIVIEGDEVETLIAASRVIWVQPGEVSAVQKAAIENFDAKRYAEALQALPGLLKERPPVWRQQWLTMMAANASRETLRGDIAIELVSQIDRRGLPPLVTAWFPIAWQNGSQPAAIVQAAQKRLQDDSPAVRLVAASWLLSSADRSDASSVLNLLAGQTDRPEIASLARCVLWRTATPPEVAASVDKWQQELNQLPMVLQTGPMTGLADKFESAGQIEAAKVLRLQLELTPIHPSPLVPSSK
ncbi:hypothetical protein Poly51_28330 [Rubripirellula tenax]|uniref:Uncharacterized protein n=1 Tax=Rubripirellula tenax TaxID=2528015 RepID=A0A5C6F6N3_9BACT|nr:hypothetical protein [Rubripirellula tenax]TWU56915.1 hypothetical protein Poly51_28330 [Rubripirellula tenax]